MLTARDISAKINFEHDITQQQANNSGYVIVGS